MTEHSEAIPRFPLAWPMGWVRARTRINAPFTTKKAVDSRLSVQVATQRLEGELDRLGASNPVLSTNVALRLDGRPRSDMEPADPGAAVYFHFRKRATVLACDRYKRVADNIAAIAAHIDALRRIERYGVGTIEQALAGYKALPADSAADWRSVFGFATGSRPSWDEVNVAFQKQARTKHPDVGGSDMDMAHLNRARDYAEMELRG